MPALIVQYLVEVEIIPVYLGMIGLLYNKIFNIGPN